MRFGIIADTHNYLPVAIFEIFKGVDQIIHAGDIGDENIIRDLMTIAPVKAVYGNMDRFPLVSHLKRIDFFKVDQRLICITHIIVSHKAFSYELFKMDKQVDVVIHGHTHRAEKVLFNNILFVNPGSASQPRSLTQASVGILEVSERNLEFDLIYFEANKK